MTDYMNLASEYVIENARRSNARIAPAEPYMVRWPASSGHLIRSDDTHDLTKKVARAMRLRDRHLSNGP